MHKEHKIEPAMSDSLIASLNQSQLEFIFY